VTGNFSGGFDWLAFPHDRSDGSALPGKHLAGTVILLAPDDATAMPLWDAGGELHDEADWLHDRLGLSYNLLAELARWNREWPGPDGSTEPCAAHHRHGRALLDRLRAEIKPRYTVVYGY
jgi:hypothetical protein